MQGFLRGGNFGCTLPNWPSQGARARWVPGSFLSTTLGCNETKHDEGCARFFFATGKMPPGVNEASIVLLPKKDDLELLTDFRLISLCNVIYKVILKCLVNRLRPLLQDIIATHEVHLFQVG
jgi:hypothetical protein